MRRRCGPDRAGVDEPDADAARRGLLRPRAPASRPPTRRVHRRRRRRSAGSRSSMFTVTRMPPASSVARRPPRSRAVIRPSQPPLTTARSVAEAPAYRVRGRGGRRTRSLGQPARGCSSARAMDWSIAGAVIVWRSSARRVARTSSRSCSTRRSASLARAARPPRRARVGPGGAPRRPRAWRRRPATLRARGTFQRLGRLVFGRLDRASVASKARAGSRSAANAHRERWHRAGRGAPRSRMPGCRRAARS